MRHHNCKNSHNSKNIWIEDSFLSLYVCIQYQFLNSVKVHFLSFEGMLVLCLMTAIHCVSIRYKNIYIKSFSISRLSYFSRF